MTYLLDTDHITILQRETGRAYATLRARLAQHPPEELAFPIISLHEQVVGCHTYINQARTAADLVRGYKPRHDLLYASASLRRLASLQWKNL